ncbi:MAG: hypothetical protein IV090_21925 [Candidatus Sericytochromatia bacterium]|nr:hypothetical protein [Candidatus Sericytochromatia bacterium]
MRIHPCLFGLSVLFVFGGCAAAVGTSATAPHTSSQAVTRPVLSADLLIQVEKRYQGQCNPDLQAIPYFQVSKTGLFAYGKTTSSLPEDGTLPLLQKQLESADLAALNSFVNALKPELEAFATQSFQIQSESSIKKDFETEPCKNLESFELRGDGGAKTFLRPELGTYLLPTPKYPQALIDQTESILTRLRELKKKYESK